MKNIKIALFCALSSLFISNAAACDCAVRTVREKFCDAHYVVTGMIKTTWMEKDPLPPGKTADDMMDDMSPTWPFRSGGALLAHYERNESFKGASTAHGLIFTTPQQGACGVALKAGLVALLFVSDYGSVYACGGSWPDIEQKEAKEAVDSLRQLSVAYSKNPASVCRGFQKRKPTSTR